MPARRRIRGWDRPRSRDFLPQLGRKAVLATTPVHHEAAVRIADAVKTGGEKQRGVHLFDHRRPGHAMTVAGLMPVVYRDESGRLLFGFVDSPFSLEGVACVRTG